jgi:phosphatidylglycerophosphatase A
MAIAPWSWGTAAAGFVLFRFFDVVKPWPASYFDRVKNGLGVVMDDVAAGVWAWGTLELARLGLRILAGCSNSHWWCLEL